MQSPGCQHPECRYRGKGPVGSGSRTGRVTRRRRAPTPRRAQLRPVIERGIARGDLRPDTDVRLVHELMVGPIFYRLLFSGGPIDPKLSTRLADLILDAFAATRNQRRRRTGP